MKLKSCLSFKPQLPKSKIFSILVIKCNSTTNNRCLRLERPRFAGSKRRRFRARFRKRFSVKALRLPKCNIKPKRKTRFRRKSPAPDVDRFGEKVSELVSALGSSRPSQENMDLGDGEKDDRALDDLTAYVDATSDKGGDVRRRFEKYVAEMIVEEGRMKDLCDVEEMLYCWKSLKSRVFADLVCEFYVEMCTDLFSREDEEEDDGRTTPSITTTTTSE